MSDEKKKFVERINAYRAKIRTIIRDIDEVNKEFREFNPAVKLHWMVYDTNNDRELEMADYSTLNRLSAIDATSDSLVDDHEGLYELSRFSGFFVVNAPFTVECVACDEHNEYENYAEFLEVGKRYVVIDHFKYKDAIYFKLEGDEMEYINSNGMQGFPSYLFSASEILMNN